MFYNQIILARKGPLGKIWLAAHFDKKLTKNQIFSTDISDSVESVLNPASPLALRVSGHLMLGIVRIYSRKVKYLMNDCTEAMWKIKLAFRPGNVDLGGQEHIASAHAIDDVRYYGNVQHDFDYPELADTAFDPDSLATYKTMKAARGRTLANLYETTQDDFDISDMMKSGAGRSPSTGQVQMDLERLPGEDETAWRRRSSASHISDIEIMRGSGGRSTLSGARTSMSMAYIDDENIPAFEEGADVMEFGEANAPTMDDYEYQYEAPPEVDDGVGGVGYDQPNEYDPSQYSQMDHIIGREEGVGVALEEPEEIVTKKKGKSGKRQKAIIDARTELTSDEMKLNQTDLARTQSRSINDPLPFHRSCEEELTAEQRIAMPSVRGLCPELMGLFDMTMNPNADNFPFPRKSSNQIEDAEMLRAAGRIGPSSRRPSDVYSAAGALDQSGAGDDAAAFEQPEYNDYEYQQETYDADPGLDVEPYGYDDGTKRRSRSGSDDLPIGALALADKKSPFAKSYAGEEDTTNASAISTWNPRTRGVFDILKDQFNENDEVSFQTIANGISRRTAAGAFLEVLQLKTWGHVDLTQDSPFADIQIKPTELLWAVEA